MYVFKHQLKVFKYNSHYEDKHQYGDYTYAQKIVAIIFNQHNISKIPRLTLNGHQVPWSKTAKYLGVHLDRFLYFLIGVQETVRKVTRVRGMLNNHSSISIPNKLSILQMYVRSIIAYAGPAWGPLISSTNWSKLEAVQNIALRNNN